MKYNSKEEAQQDHIKNYRSDGIIKQRGTQYASDFLRVQFIIDNVPKKAHVLDVGCNGGTIALPLMQLGCYVKGIDIVPKLVEVAKKRGVFAEVGEAEDLSRFKSNTFDAVICAEVLEHLFDPLPAIEEAYRVLKKKGIYLVTVPHPAGAMCTNKLGDYHQQNFDMEIISTLFKLVFKEEKITIWEIPYNPYFCKAHGIDPKSPQWLAIRSVK